MTVADVSPPISAYQRFTPSSGSEMYQPSFRSLIGSTATLHPFGPGGEFLRAPLASTSYSLLSGLWLDFHQLVDAHAGRTAPSGMTPFRRRCSLRFQLRSLGLKETFGVKFLQGASQHFKADFANNLRQSRLRTDNFWHLQISRFFNLLILNTYSKHQQACIAVHFLQ